MKECRRKYNATNDDNKLELNESNKMFGTPILTPGNFHQSQTKRLIFASLIDKTLLLKIRF